MMKRRDVLTGGVALAMSIKSASAKQPSGFYVPAEETAHERTFM